MMVSESICVQGYKGDPERKIGIIGRADIPRGSLQRRIEEEFGSVELFQEGASDQVQVVAIMNAFNADEVHRVMEMAQQHEWVSSGGQAGRHVLYLTGQARENGLTAAKKHGMSVACVGHAAAEEWGIRYMARQFRAAFPGLSVEEVYEEEDSSSKK
jgi:putative NIF3 family GTP cyclohydrolase 1 type 2